MKTIIEQFYRTSSKQRPLIFLSSPSFPAKTEVPLRNQCRCTIWSDPVSFQQASHSWRSSTCLLRIHWTESPRFPSRRRTSVSYRTPMIYCPSGRTGLLWYRRDTRCKPTDWDKKWLPRSHILTFPSFLWTPSSWSIINILTLVK